MKPPVLLQERPKVNLAGDHVVGPIDTDPNERESVVLLPELESIHPA
jgi:hypothetical protein